MKITSSHRVQQQATQSASRRGLMLSVFSSTAFVISQNQPAMAFGNGFPGYDINLDGRKRALERNKREMEVQKKLAADFRAKKAAAAKASEASEQK